MADSEQLRVGVLLIDTVGLLDLAAIDIFNICSSTYLQSRGFPTSITSLAPSVSFLYISQTDDNNDFLNNNSDNAEPEPDSDSTVFAKCTANGLFKVSHSLSSDDCAPGKLDVLVIPGPQPWVQITPKVKSFIQRHHSTTTILSICTGAFVLAQSGILDHRQATGTKAHMHSLKKTYQNVKWVTRRWVNDGNIWTSGTVTNGVDMVAAFLKQRYPGVLSETVCEFADVPDRGVDLISTTADDDDDVVG